jgi:hypothetical protein
LRINPHEKENRVEATVMSNPSSRRKPFANRVLAAPTIRRATLLAVAPCQPQALL